MSQEMLKTIEEEVANHRVMLYMKGNKDFPMCGFSAQVVHILNTLGAEYETRDVLQDDELRQSIKEYSDWPTLPQLYIGGEFVGGCDIAMELYENGELKTLLATNSTENNSVATNSAGSNA